MRHLGFRTDDADLARLDAVRARLAVPTTRSALAREALRRGLASLEAVGKPPRAGACDCRPAGAPRPGAED